MRLRIAHLSDLHLPTPDAPEGQQWLSKRMIGYANWFGKRRHWHQLAVLDALAADIKQNRVDVVLISGDIINIALQSEYEAAARWLRQAFGDMPVVIAPGNHDLYAPIPWEQSLAHWTQWLTGLRRHEAQSRACSSFDDFPFLREFAILDAQELSVANSGGVAIIVANSAPPGGTSSARGRLGSEQIADIGALLTEAGRKQQYRILMLHHPVQEDVVAIHKKLIDQQALRDKLVSCGVELILHGHAHLSHVGSLTTRSGEALVLGVGSASHIRAAGAFAAGRYHWLDFTRDGSGRNKMSLTLREWDPEARNFSTPGTGPESKSQPQTERETEIAASFGTVT